jgi:hypothetical protein
MPDASTQTLYQTTPYSCLCFDRATNPNRSCSHMIAHRMLVGPSYRQAVLSTIIPNQIPNFLNGEQIPLVRQQAIPPNIEFEEEIKNDE